MDGIINSQTIPAWLVALSLITTGIMWIMAYKRNIRMDFRVFALTFILQGVLFGIIFQIMSVDIELRGFTSRLLIIMLCLSQSLPLAVSYLRSSNRE